MGKTNRKNKSYKNKTKKVKKHSKLCKCKSCKCRKNSNNQLKSKILRQKNKLPKHFRKAKYHGGMNPGGMTYKPTFAYSNLSASMRGGKLPVGLVGYPYDGGNVDTWPGALASSGVSAANHMSNYYPLSPNGSGAGGVEYPIPSNNLLGGKRKRSKRLKKKGKSKTKRNKYNQKGGFFPDVVDLARQQLTNATNTYNAFVGESPYPSPYPYEQPINENVKLVSFKPTDL